MTAIKALNKITELWKKRSGAASSEYRDGVQNPKRDWKDATVAANDARIAGLEASEERNAFVTGVEDAGTEKWKRRSVSVGPARYRQGVAAGGDEFNKGFSRYHGVISALTLPPRGPKGSPENHERSRKVADALHAEKVGS